MARIDRAKNTLSTAKVIRNLSSSPQTFSDSVGKTDRNDLYQIRLANSSTLHLTLNRIGKRSKVGVQLFTLKGAKDRALWAIGRSEFSDLSLKQTKKYINLLAKTAGAINLALNAGEYYVRVYQNQGKSHYRLNSSISSNSAPISPLDPTTSNPPPISPLDPATLPPNLPLIEPVPPPKTFPASTWTRQFGTSDNDYAYGTAADSEGDIYVSGVTTPSGALSGSGFVAKYSKDGSEEWRRSLSISGSNVGFDVAVDATGNYYVVGAKVNGFNSDGFIAKYSSDGQQEWIEEIKSTTFGIDAAASVVLDGNNIYVTGIRQGAPVVLGSQGKAFVAKYSSNGKLANDFGNGGIVEFGNARTTAASGIAIAAGKIYIAGITDAALNISNGSDFNLSGGDAFVASFDDSTGALLWQDQTLSSGTGTDYARGIAVNGSEIYLVGQTAGTLPSGSLPASVYGGGDADAFLAKYTVNNNKGALQWVKEFGGSGLDAAQAITIDLNGKIYLTGETNTSLFNTAAGGSDAWIAQADSSGSLIRAIQIGTPQDDEAYGIATDSLGNLDVAGQTQGSFPNAASQTQGKYDAWLTQYPQPPE